MRARPGGVSLVRGCFGAQEIECPPVKFVWCQAPAEPAAQTHSTVEKTSSATPADVPPLRPELLHALHRAWTQVAQHVLANTDDVGDRFAEEARRIHYGETEERGIRGQTTPEEARELVEEGIELLALPIPEHLKKPLQ